MYFAPLENFFGWEGQLLFGEIYKGPLLNL